MYFFGYLLHHCCKARRHGRTCSAIAHSSRMETIGDIILPHVEGYSRWMQLTCQAWTLYNCTWTVVFECFSTKVSTFSFEFRPKKHLLRLVEARVWGVDRRVRYLWLAWQKIYRNHWCLDDSFTTSTKNLVLFREGTSEVLTVLHFFFIRLCSELKIYGYTHTNEWKYEILYIFTHTAYESAIQDIKRRQKSHLCYCQSAICRAPRTWRCTRRARPGDNPWATWFSPVERVNTTWILNYKKTINFLTS